MSAWRRKAIEMFPHLRNLLNDSQTSVGIVFGDIEERLEGLYKQGKLTEVKKCFDFVEWCYQQKNAPDLHSAASVFYCDHVGYDDEIIREVLVKFLNPSIFSQMENYFRNRLSNKKVNKIKKMLQKSQP